MFLLHTNLMKEVVFTTNLMFLLHTNLMKEVNVFTTH